MLVRRATPGVISVIVVSAALLTSCGGSDSESTSRSPVPDYGLGHVHGLGVDPADDSLFIASHTGVYRVAEGHSERVANRYQDTMAFTVVGPGHFLASGHPDLREDLPTHLGLIESTDAAQTWQPVSLQGKADFHALATTDNRTYGYDSLTRSLLTTTDGRRWETVMRGEVSDLAANPADPGQVLITRPPGRVELIEHGSRTPAPQPLDNAPPVVLLDWSTPSELAGATVTGEIWVSADAGLTWQATRAVPGNIEAFDTAADVWHAATDQGVFASTNQGRSWNLVEGVPR